MKIGGKCLYEYAPASFGDHTMPFMSRFMLEMEGSKQTNDQ